MTNTIRTELSESKRPAYTIETTFLFSGMGDYWKGDGDRWEDNAGCLFAYYGAGTTLRELVDQWVDDYLSGGDCDSFTIDIDDGEIRESIVETMLSDSGRADYANNAIAECAIEYADANDIVASDDDDDDDDDDFGDDFDDGESPVAIILVKIVVDDDDDGEQ
jgi:hypothetical protein